MFKKIVAVALVIVLTYSVFPFERVSPVEVMAVSAVGAADMRGLWVTSAFNLDWPSRQGLSNAEIMAQTEAILVRAASQNINAVFVQVRPAADALYSSNVFPWSHTLTGTQGVAPSYGFSPLAHFIESAEPLGIEVHAWINPFRVTKRNPQIDDRDELIATLSPGHPARQNPDLVIAYNNMLFFDPGQPEARGLIIAAIKDLLQNYAISGIHLDDYFYPSRNFPDSHTFAQFGGGMDLHDWRRENINILIRDIHQSMRRIDPTARFGVSPFAVWQNDINDPRGSATSARESYHADYADTRRWVLEGWLDYIVPQIYWPKGHAAACFEAVIGWWEDLVRGTNVNLYIGHAVYREVDMANRPGWTHGEIVRQLERVTRSDVARGSLFFRAEHMNSGVGEQISNFYGRLLGRETLPPPPPHVVPGSPAVRMDSLMVVQPSANVSANGNGFFFFGSGVAGLPIYVNGQLVANRTEEGFFSVFLPLSNGVNNFTFSQYGQPSITRTITNTVPAVTPPDIPTMVVPDIINAFPARDVWARHGQHINLSVNAPAGSNVWATVEETVVHLEQANPELASTADSIVSAQFIGSFVLSRHAPYGEIIELGRPVYSFEWGTHSGTTTASGAIFQIGAETQLFAEITEDFAWVFPGPYTAGGSDQMLFRGQIDKVAATSGDWTRLASGGWVETRFIRTFSDHQKQTTNLNLGFFSEGRYKYGEFYDIIFWDIPFHPIVFKEFDGQRLIVSLGLQQHAPLIFYNPNQTMFESIEIGTRNGAPAYFMNLRQGANLEGMYTKYENGRFSLVLRKRRPLVPGNYPLLGFTFVLDPGHGGNDVGALGPMGAQMAESHIVLNQSLLLAKRLRQLGANVVLTRETDVAVPHQRRVDISRQNKPDMFLSLHTNAMGVTTDSTNIRGFTVWHRNPASHPAAYHFMEILHDVNPATNRHRAPSQANFFVCRPLWAPSILLEASFTNNIHDFSWLISEQGKNDYVWQIVNAILSYYAR